MTKKLTQEQIQEVIELYQNGENLTQIGKRFGVLYGSIKGLLKRRGISIRSTWNRKKPHMPYKQRFWNKVNKDGPIQSHMSTPCWKWTGGITKAGYGIFSIKAEEFKNYLAHRYSYKLHFGEIPPGMNILHHCDNPSCVNPEHLFIGTHQDNTNDRMTRNRHKVLLGEKNPASKLTWIQVKEIRKRYATEKTSCKKLSKDYGVDTTAIHHILTNKTWREQ